MSEIPVLNIEQAAEVVRGGGVVATPSESVFGFSCDPANEAATRRLLKIKRRNPGQGLILVGGRTAHADSLLDSLTDVERARVMGSWPGPMTWLIPAAGAVPRWITGNHETVAVRITDHRCLAALCDAFGGLIVSTSANRHGEPPARTRRELQARFAGVLDGIVAGELGGRQKPSEIRDARTGEVLRAGDAARNEEVNPR